MISVRDAMSARRAVEALMGRLGRLGNFGRAGVRRSREDGNEGRHGSNAMDEACAVIDPEYLVFPDDLEPVCNFCEASPVVEVVGDFGVCEEGGCAAMAYRRSFGICD